MTPEEIINKFYNEELLPKIETIKSSASIPEETAIETAVSHFKTIETTQDVQKFLEELLHFSKGTIQSLQNYKEVYFQTVGTFLTY